MKNVKNDKNENPLYLAEHTNWQLRIFTFPFFALPLGAVISDLPRVSFLTIVGLFISICFGTIFLLRWGVIFKPEERLITTFWGPYFLKFKSNLNSDNIKYFKITRKLNSLSNEEALMLYDFIAVIDDGNEKDIVKGVGRKDYEKLLNTLKYYSKEIVNDWKVDATPKNSEVYDVTVNDLPEKTVTKFIQMKDGLLIEFPGQNLRSYISILLPFIAVITPIVVMVPVSELIQKPFNPFQVFALALSLIGIYKLSKVIRKQKIIVSEINGLTVINYYFIKPAKVRNIPVDMFSGSSLILTDREEDKKFPFTLPIIGGIYKFFLLRDISEVAASGESGNLYFGNALPFKEKIIILNLINNILKNS